MMYSQAARCQECDAKALLQEGGARALERTSEGTLTAYRCPHGDGWHVRRAESSVATSL